MLTGRAIFCFLKSCFCKFFCLTDILWMNNITRHYCLIDYDQQFAAIGHFCCRKVSFFKIAVPHRASSPLNSLKIEKMGWKLLQHLPYNPDSAPSNFHLFGSQSKSLGDIMTKNDKDVLQHFVRKFLQMPIKKLNATGSSRLVEQWKHCRELQGEYVEK